jgi:hypothetical protein
MATSPTASHSKRVLLIFYGDPEGITTVMETVGYMQSVSRFPITVINLFEHRSGPGILSLRPEVDFDEYKAVVIHNTVSYNVYNLRSLDTKLRTKLRKYTGVKILMKQDENYRFHELARYIGETGFDVIFTCLPPEAVTLIYPPQIVGTPHFERMFTGYVTPTLRQRRWDTTSRPIDIGYRGSIQPLHFGRLAYEKRKIGEDIQARLANSGLKLDISSRWEDRIGGDAWFDFLASCKATLGAESGASIFDLAGDLDARCKALEQKLGPLREDADYAEAYLSQLADLEDNVHYHQISPRHFEAAATGTVQLLYPGDYSGIFKAGQHYFPLARDYSNLDEAVALIQNEPARRSMAEAAYREIVQNPAYWIETFVGRFDALLAAEITAKASRIQANPHAAKPTLRRAHNFSRQLSAKMLLFRIISAAWNLTPPTIQRRLEPIALKLFQKYYLP